jgi:hypothetical protein
MAQAKAQSKERQQPQAEILRVEMDGDLSRWISGLRFFLSLSPLTFHPLSLCALA